MALSSLEKKLFRSKSEREQADAFRRDLVIRPSARIGGQWSVGVRETTPASQTNMGRLASSLSQVSGLLNQFNQFQLQKDQAKHKALSLRTELAIGKENLLQAQLQNQALDQRILMQEERTAELESKRADVEWDNWWQKLSLDEQDEYRKNQEREVERFNAGVESAERAIDAAVGSEIPRKLHPLNSPNLGPERPSRSQLRMGASLQKDYEKFFFKRVEEIGESIRGSTPNTELSAEEAQEMVRGILGEYLEEKEIDPNSGQGRGLIAAASAFNEDKMPLYANTLLQEAEVLQQKNIQSTVSGWTPENGIRLPELSTELERWAGYEPEEETVEEFTSSIGHLNGSQVQTVERQLLSEGLTLNNLEDERGFRRALELSEAVRSPSSVKTNEIIDAPWFAEFQAMSSAEKMKIIAGDSKFDGLIKLMGRDETDAKLFQILLDDFGDHLMVDGKIFKDHLEYNNLVEQAEANVAQAMEQAMKNEEAAFNRGVSELKKQAAIVMQEPTSTKAEVESWAIRMKNAGRDPMSKAEFLEIVPDMADAIDGISESQWPEFLITAGSQFEIFNASRQKSRDVLMEDLRWWKRLSNDDELTKLLRAHTAGAESPSTRAASEILEAGKGLTVADLETPEEMRIGSEGLQMLRPLIETYSEELDAAFESALRDNPGLAKASPAEQREALGDVLEDINDRFRVSLSDHLKNTAAAKDKEDALAEAKEVQDAAKAFNYDLLPRVDADRLADVKSKASNWHYFWNHADYRGLKVLQGDGTERWKRVDELRIHIPQATQALREALPANKEEQRKYRVLFEAAEVEAGSRVVDATESGGLIFKHVTKYADRSTNAVTYWGRQEKAAEKYRYYANHTQALVRQKASLSVEPKEILELIQTRDVFDDPATPFTVYDADYFMGVGPEYAKKDLKESGDGMTNYWKRARMPIVLLPNHFQIKQPVLKGLPPELKKDRFEGYPIDQVVESTGLSKSQLESIASVYGFEDVEGFLDKQYSHPYYKTLKAADATAANLDPAEGARRRLAEPEPELTPSTPPPSFTGPPPPDPSFSPDTVEPEVDKLEPSVPETGAVSPEESTGVAKGELDATPVTAEPEPMEAETKEPATPEMSPTITPEGLEPVTPPKLTPERPPVKGWTPIVYKRTGAHSTKPEISAKLRKNVTILANHRESAEFKASAAASKSKNVLSTDFNDAANKKAKGIEVVLAGNASAEQIAAAETYVRLVDQFMKNSGVTDNPIRDGSGKSKKDNKPGILFKKKVTSSKGPRFMYTEPFFASHAAARKAIENNPKEYARILVEAFGGLPGLVVIPPHVERDRGAVSDGVSEQEWSQKYIIPHLQELMADRTTI